MKIHEVEQGTIEWMQARLGIPTASQFDRIITAKKLKPSSAQTKYRAELLAEWLLGQPLEWGTSAWMERGVDLESEARRYYELQEDADVRRVGFVTHENGLVGGSPDGLVGDDGILEIKCPAAHTHVAYMLGEDPDYIGQVQGYMWLTERDWTDVLSYNPHLPPVINRVHRDEKYAEALVPELEKFTDRLEKEKGRLAHHKVSRPWDPEIQELLATSEASP